MSDYDVEDEQHLMPFDGSVDWKQLIGDLESVGYQGYFTFEIGGKGYSIAQMKKVYDRLMAFRA